MSPAPSTPPGPTGFLSGLRLIPRIRENLIAHMESLAKTYGDAVAYSIAGVSVYQFSHPDTAVEVLSTKNQAFQKPTLLRQVLGQWNGNGLVVNEGESWVRQRRLVSPAFKPQRIAEHVDTVVRRADRLLGAWRGRGEVDAARDLADLTLGVVAEALFGADVEHLSGEFIEQVAVLNGLAIRELSAPLFIPTWAPTPLKGKVRHATAVLRNTVDDIISQRRRAGEERRDLLAALLSARDEEGDGGPMNDVQARDEAVNLLLAGNETTATALTWTLYLLARNPEVQQRVAAEVAEVLGDRAPRAEDLPKLRLVEMAFKEAMRLYPPAYIVAREAAEDVDVGGYRVPKGALAQVAVYVIQRDARWFDAPLEFRPERFASEASIRRGAYLPFGAGPRVCIGRGFALMEGTIALSRLVQRARFSPSPSGKEVEVAVEVSLHPRGGLPLVVEVR